MLWLSIQTYEARKFCITSLYLVGHVEKCLLDTWLTDMPWSLDNAPFLKEWANGPGAFFIQEKMWNHLDKSHVSEIYLFNNMNLNQVLKQMQMEKEERVEQVDQHACLLIPVILNHWQTEFGVWRSKEIFNVTTNMLSRKKHNCHFQKSKILPEIIKRNDVQKSNKNEI